MSNTPFCTLCGTWFESTDELIKSGSYCKDCWRVYQQWRYHQLKAGLNGTIGHYRYVFDKPKLKPHGQVPEDERMGQLKECPICFTSHVNAGSYCKPCKSAYVNWCMQRRKRGLTTFMDEFKYAYDAGRVEPRRNAAAKGKVVKGL